VADILSLLKKDHEEVAGLLDRALKWDGDDGSSARLAEKAA
jgi:hypothetical protein